MPLMSLALVILGMATAIVAWLMLRRAMVLWDAYGDRLRHDASSTLDASFIFLDARLLLPAMWAVGLPVALLAGWLSGQWWLVAPAAIALLAAPELLLGAMRKRRESRFDAQLPDFVQALAGALRAGSGLQPALRQIVRHAQAPLAQEFALLLREQRLGIGMRQALLQLRDRVPTQACSLLVSALVIAGRTGGSLADTLDGMSQTLRAQQHWLGRIKALTAQGRMQSHIMAGLPLLLLGVLARLEPQAMAPLWSTWPGWLVLATIAVLETLGIIWIRRVVAIDV